MTVAGQTLAAVALVVAAFVVVGLVEMVCALDLGGAMFCAVFAGLATVTLATIYPTAKR